MSASKLLARGWFKGSKRWWIGTAFAMGVSLALVFIVAGTLNGLEVAMQERVGDFYTEEARLTAGPAGTAPGNHVSWPTEAALAATLGETGDGELRMESQFLLSRRGLIQAYLTEDDQFTIGTPGGSNNDKNQYGIGVLVGQEAGSFDGVRPYLLRGSALPVPRADADVDHEPLEFVMSVDALASYLTDAEEESFSNWPPSNAELRTIRFEITAARIDDETNFDYDIIRFPAVPVGLYETDLDALDQFTVFAPIEEVRRLLGYNGSDLVGNVITSEDGDAAAQFAAKRQWTSEDSETFSKRFIGQMVEVVQSLSLLVTVLLFLVPVFLLWYGLTQQLDRQRRELAVCQALGMEERTLRFGLTRLVAKVLLIAGAVLGVALGGYLLLFYGFIQGWDGSPFPLAYLVPWWAILSVAVLIAAGVTSALFWTAKRQHRRDLVATLRAQ